MLCGPSSENETGRADFADPPLNRTGNALATPVKLRKIVALKTEDKNPFWNIILQNGRIIIEIPGVDIYEMAMKSIYDATLHDSRDWHVF
jgi:hypothetical protein